MLFATWLLVRPATNASCGVCRRRLLRHVLLQVPELGQEQSLEVPPSPPAFQRPRCQGLARMCRMPTMHASHQDAAPRAIDAAPGLGLSLSRKRRVRAAGTSQDPLLPPTRLRKAESQHIEIEGQSRSRLLRGWHQKHQQEKQHEYAHHLRPVDKPATSGTPKKPSQPPTRGHPCIIPDRVTIQM